MRLGTKMLAVVATATFTAAVPVANAEASESRCGATNFCLFTGPNFTDAVRAFSQDQPDLGQSWPQFNNTASSVANHSNVWVALWTNANYNLYGGSCSDLAPGEARNLVGSANDSITSINYNATC